MRWLQPCIKSDLDSIRNSCDVSKLSVQFNLKCSSPYFKRIKCILRRLLASLLHDVLPLPRYRNVFNVLQPPPLWLAQFCLQVLFANQVTYGNWCTVQPYNLLLAIFGRTTSFQTLSVPTALTLQFLECLMWWFSQHY